MTDRYVAVEDLRGLLRSEARLIGLDLGEKTIGVAVSDVNHGLASPLVTLARGKFGENAAQLRAIFESEKACAVVIGLPLNMDGSEGPRAQATRAFARNLAAAGAPPICLWDERWSTAAVQRAMIDADVSRKRRAEAVDKLAAAFILQGALDRMNFSRP
ncbi:MAG: Holliday junction resolvase RuvX [Hyphomicrobiales bacterium]|nr:Holliday junction resolvase RuvX [Hyphomicrobiales bacterium]